MRSRLAFRFRPRSFIGLLGVMSLIFSLFPLLPARQVQAAVLSRAPNNLGLVGYWSLDDGSGSKATDQSGNGNTGTLQNMEAGDWVAGKRGKALDFDGSNEYVTVSDPGTGSILDFGNATTITMSAWVNPASLGNYQTILTKGRTAGSDNPNYVLRTELTTNKLAFYYRNSTNTAWHVYASTTSPFSAGTWTHVAVTFTFGTGSGIKLYANGAEIAGSWIGGTGNEAPLESNDPLWIGSSDGTADEPFPGKIDEARIYNRILGGTEITYLYNSGRVQYKTASNTGLVGYWSMDDGSGTKAGDSSGQGNTGTLTNMEAGDWVAGKRGKALSFDGTGNEYVTTSDISSLDNSAELSLSAWVKIGTLSTDMSIISKSPDGSGNHRFQMSLGGGGYGGSNDITVSVGDAGNQYGYTEGDIISAGEWIFLTMVFNGGLSGNSNRLKLYKNGALQSLTFGGGVTIPATTSASNTGVLEIGAETLAAGNRYFNGLIDEVRAYNRALTSTEITALYQLGSAKVSSSQNNVLTNGLVGCWSMNGADTVWSSSTAGTVDDCSTNSNTGTLTNMERATDVVAGRVGQALDFDGVDENITINSVMGLGATDVTMANWVYLSSTSESGAFIKIGRDSSPYNGYQIGVGSNTMDANGNELIGAFEGIRWIDTNTNIGTGWHHVAMTINGSGTPTMYLDGVSLGTFAGTNAGAPSTDGTKIGGYTETTTPSNRFGAYKIDEVRVYNRALSADEVKQLHNLGR